MKKEIKIRYIKELKMQAAGWLGFERSKVELFIKEAQFKISKILGSDSHYIAEIDVFHNGITQNIVHDYQEQILTTLSKIEFEIDSFEDELKNNFFKPNEMRLNKIFISFSNKDEEIVNQFVSLILSNALNINTNEKIFCTGIEGSKPNSGEDFRELIKSELKNAQLVLQFISHNYRQSAICLNEMGAAWVSDAYVIPLVVEKDNYDVGFIHNTIQQVQLTSEENLLQLVEELENIGAIKKYSLPLLNKKIKDFVSWLENHSKNEKNVGIEKPIEKIDEQSPFYIINNQSNWYQKRSTKYFEIPDELTKAFLGYKNGVKINKIEMDEYKLSKCISKTPLTSVTYGKFSRLKGDNQIWLIFENKRYAIQNSFTFELIRKAKDLRKEIVYIEDISKEQLYQIKQGDILNFE